MSKKIVTSFTERMWRVCPLCPYSKAWTLTVWRHVLEYWFYVATVNHVMLIAVNEQYISPSLLFSLSVRCLKSTLSPPQWGAADTEIKVPSGQNTELKSSPFRTRSRSVYSHICNTYCRDFFLAYFYPSSIRVWSPIMQASPAFFLTPLPISPVLAVANTWFLCRPAE